MFRKLARKIHDNESAQKAHSQVVCDKEFVISWINLSLRKSSLHHTTLDDKVDSGLVDLESETENGIIKSAEFNSRNASKKTQKRQFIFEHVSGTLCSGQTTAILGPRGCGKSSIVKCLSGFYRSRLHGTISLYRTKPGSRSTDHKIRIAFIPQFDCFFTCLTVFEIMLFTSRLVNLENSSKEEKEKYFRKQIKNILDSLDLFSALRTRIDHLSCGQQRRLSIALEFLSKPDVLILDEPTKGLDSYASFKCIQLFNKLIKERKIYSVLMVLHQPGTIALNLIDKLYIMSRTGSIIYNGLTKDLIEFFDRIHIDLPAYTNPADLIIEIASGTNQQLLNKLTNSFSIPIEQYIKNLQDLEQLKYAHGEFKSVKRNCVTSQYDRQAVRKVERCEKFDEIKKIEISKKSTKMTDINDHIFYDINLNECKLVSWTLFDQAIQKHRFEFSSSFFNLTRRYVYLIFKDQSLGRNRLLASVLLGLFVGYMYGSEIGRLDGCSITHSYVQQKLIETSKNLKNISLEDTNVFQSKSIEIVREYNRKQAKGVIDNTSNMFFILLVVILINLIPALTSLSNEYRVVSKEINNLKFHYFPYFLSKISVDTSFSIVLNLIFISITYYLSNYPFEINRFLIYAGVLILFALTIDALSLIIASLCVGNLFATIYISLITVFLLLIYTGYLIKIFHMHKLFRLMSRISPSLYTYETMLISIYGRKRCSKNFETKLYNLKNFLLKTFEDDSKSDRLTSTSVDEMGRMRSEILSVDKTDTGGHDAFIETINTDLIKPITDQKKQNTTSINYLTDKNTPDDHLTKFESENAFVNHSKIDSSNYSKTSVSNDTIKNRSKRQSTGNYDHFNLINLKQQLVSNKNLIRFLRLTSALDSGQLNGILMHNKDGVAFYSYNNMSQMMINNTISNRMTNVVNSMGSDLNVSNNTSDESMYSEIDSLKNDRIKINNEATNLSQPNDSTANDVKNLPNDQSTNNVLIDRSMTYFTSPPMNKLTSRSIKEDLTDQPANDDIADQQKNDDIADQQTNDDSIDETIIKSTVSSDQTTSEKSIDDLAINSISSKMGYNSFDDGLSANETTDEIVERNGKKSTHKSHVSDPPEDDPIDQTTINEFFKTDHQTTGTESAPENFSTSTGDKSNDHNFETEYRTRNTINIYRLPLDRNLSDDQIPEYEIPNDVLLNLLNNFFKRIGVPDVEPFDDSDERSRVLMIYDIKSDKIAFNFQFIFSFYLCIRAISYFIYRYRVQKFD